MLEDGDDNHACDHHDDDDRDQFRLFAKESHVISMMMITMTMTLYY